MFGNGITEKKTKIKVLLKDESVLKLFRGNSRYTLKPNEHLFSVHKITVYSVE